MARLTATKVKNVKERGRYSDDNGLCLMVSVGKNGNLRRSWTQRVRANGRRIERGLGSVNDITLAEARRIAVKNKATAEGGESPWPERPPAPTPEPVDDGVVTFERMAREFHADYDKLTNEKNRKNWLNRAEKYLFPSIGSIPITDITRRSLLELLVPLSKVKPETAKRLAIIARQTLDHAITYEYLDSNPADKRLTAKLTVPNPEHYEALPYYEVPDALSKIRDSEAWLSTRLAFEFTILTAARTNEVRLARWEHMDMADAIWTRPEDFMKTRVQHRQPLSIQAMLVLQEARRKLDDGSGQVFPRPRGKKTPAGMPLSSNALLNRAKKDRLGCTPHGFRASFTDFAVHANADRLTRELCLAHEPRSKTELSYDRDDRLAGRRELLQAWADHVSPLPF